MGLSLTLAVAKRHYYAKEEELYSGAIFLGIIFTVRAGEILKTKITPLFHDVKLLGRLGGGRSHFILIRCLVEITRARHFKTIVGPALFWGK